MVSHRTLVIALRGIGDLLTALEAHVRRMNHPDGEELYDETADPNVRSGLDTLAATMTVVLEATRAAMTSDLKPETIAALAGNAVGWLKPMIARAGGIINGDEEVTDAVSPQAVVDQLMKR